MEQDKLIIIHEALNEASYLISNEIQCVIDEELYSEYNRVLEKIDSALQIIKKFLRNFAKKNGTRQIDYNT